jgi:hypothetical protein
MTRDHDKFIVEHNDKTQLLAQTEYLCIQFLKRSNDVIQIKTSTKMSVKSPSMCDNLNLNEDSIVSPVILDFNEASLMYVAIHILLCVTKSGNVHCDVTSDVMVINDKIRLNTQ